MLVKVDFVFRWKICEEYCFWTSLWKAVNNYIILYHRAELAHTAEGIVNVFSVLELETISLGQEKMTDKVNLMEGLILDKMPDASLAKSIKYK